MMKFTADFSRYFQTDSFTISIKVSMIISIKEKSYLENRLERTIREHCLMNESGAWPRDTYSFSWIDLPCGGASGVAVIPINLTSKAMSEVEKDVDVFLTAHLRL
jgi:hypothetical protein